MSEQRFVYDEYLDVIQYWEDGVRFQLDVHNLKDVTETLNTLQARIELLEDNCLADTLTRKHLEGIIDEQQATISALKEENEQLKKARDKSDKFIVKKGLEIEFLEWCIK